MFRALLVRVDDCYRTALASWKGGMLSNDGLDAFRHEFLAHRMISVQYSDYLGDWSDSAIDWVNKNDSLGQLRNLAQGIPN